MVGVYNYTVIATYLGLASGTFGIFWACRGNVEAALVCLMVAGIVDTFDGKIARTKKDRTETEMRFGVQIDSLCDMVSFGVLPPVICFAAGLTCMGHAVLYILFALTAVIRLAYFNVLAEENRDKGGNPAYHGLPVTSISVILPTVYIAGRLLGKTLSVLLSLSMLAVALLYISPIRVKKPRVATLGLLAVLGAAEAALLLSGRLP